MMTTTEKLALLKAGEQKNAENIRKWKEHRAA